MGRALVFAGAGVIGAWVCFNSAPSPNAAPRSKMLRFSSMMAIDDFFLCGVMGLSWCLMVFEQSADDVCSDEARYMNGSIVEVTGGRR